MMKKLMALVVCLALTLTLIPAAALVFNTESASAASIVMPNDNGKTNGGSYVLGAGTDAEVTVYRDWRSTSMKPTGTFTPKYIMIHNTGTYVSTATAKNVHTNTNKTSTGAAWHYTVDDKAIYQGLADNRKGWHAATSYSNYPSNVNAIGIETCVNSFPATETFGGEQWTNGTAIMQWWENQFDQTMKHAAYLSLVLCERWGLNWQTAIVMHWNAFQYDTSTKKGKDCPMQMRATYNPSTNQFAKAGYYADGRDGYFWQMFWSYVTAYASGSKVAGATGSTAAKLGTYQVKSSDGLNVRTGASTSYDLVGALENSQVVEVTELNGNWGHVIASDGLEGWASIANYGEYIGVDAQAYTVTPGTSGLQHSYNSDGSLVLKNDTPDRGVVDLNLPHAIGTLTTPFMSLQVTPNYGNGFFFGISQAGSGHWMMRDCQSSDQLVQEDNAPYMTNAEKLEIDLRDWWTTTDYQVDVVRFYVAPQSSITINYFYFTDAAGTVSDIRYNLRASASNTSLMHPASLRIVDETKKGSYTYNKGRLTVVSEDASGYEVSMDTNLQFAPNDLKRLLYSVDSKVRYDIELLVSTSEGDRIVSLVSDFWPGLCEALDGDYLPAAEQSAGLDLLSVYTWNNVLPADGLSTIKKVTFQLGGAGTMIVNSVQIAANDRLMNLPDDVTKSDYSPKEVVPDEPDVPVEPDVPDEPETPADLGDINGDGQISTNDARLAMLHAIGGGKLNEAQIKLADYNGDGEVTTIDARLLMLYALTHA